MAKRKMNKSYFKSLFILILTLTVVAGCSGKTNTDPTDSAAPSPENASTSSPNSTDSSSAGMDTKEFVTLTWYMPPPLDPRPNEDKVMKYLNEILKEKINVNLVFKFVDWSTYAQKIKVSSAAGEEFDIFSDFGSIGFSQNVSSGIALELDDLLNQYGKDIIQKNPDKAWQAVTSNGKKYGIANPSAWVETPNFAFRNDIVDKYNIDYASIHNFKDLEPVLKMLKENEPDLIPYLGVFGMPQTFDKITPTIGYDTTDGKWKSLLDSKAWLDVTRIQKDWYEKGYIPKKVVEGTDSVAEFKTGRYAVTSYSIYDASFVKISTDFATPMVASPLDYKNLVTGSSIRGAINYISKTSKHPERAMMLLNLLYADKELFNKFAYGIEGQDWDYVSGKGTDNPTVKTKDQMGWAIWHPWIGSLWDQWPSNWNSQAVLDGLKSAIDKAEYSPYVGFVFDSAPVKKELAQIEAITPETRPLFMSKDLDGKIAEYKDRLNKAGLETVLAEIQKQVDAWKATGGN
ncbi:extracellular solute-binding protein [Paenibacillus eucommiae]|uniref:Aldouronate transport system substrate-binding protein n=1 Tax=Paenibacillus eucommiae TaxID=1355755 RepID=A0ABS4IWH3_9BACL|nr:extracellular solute-binding protein [Paenibacillus eucommiae]MBP1991940.1 putative aldouronate transport system substrate-binding protein [Paenibacillus eucommiae]